MPNSVISLKLFVSREVKPTKSCTTCAMMKAAASAGATVPFAWESASAALAGAKTVIFERASKEARRPAISMIWGKVVSSVVLRMPGAEMWAVKKLDDKGC